MSRRHADSRTVARVQVTARERAEMEDAARRSGFPSVGEYLRHLHRQHARGECAESREGSDGDALTEAANGLRLFHRTALGAALCGDALGHLREAPPRSVDLVMTSPPFGLVRKKSYGNEDAHRYCDWFRPFAAGFRRVLKDRGSLVIDIGGAWKPGTPTRSLYHFELLLMLCEEYGFHLCQEHYWWNPSKLPTPAEWVNIRRVRVKDAVNCVWWLSPTPWPKAGNRRVLAPYSKSMRGLLKTGTGRSCALRDTTSPLTSQRTTGVPFLPTCSLWPTPSPTDATRTTAANMACLSTPPASPRNCRSTSFACSPTPATTCWTRSPAPA